MKLQNDRTIIGIDASRAYDNDRTGTENYSYQIINEIVKLSSEFEYKLYLRPESKLPAHLEKVTAKRIMNHKQWTQLGLALETWQRPVDLLFVPAHVIPILKNISLPVVLTIHDLRTEFLPQHNSFLQKIYLNKYTEMLRANMASQIIAVSNSTKNDIVQMLKVPQEKVTVVYEGVDRDRFNPNLIKDEERIGKLKEAYKLEKEFILYVGTIQPRKNLVRLIEAFSSLGEITQSIDLVLVGKRGWLADDIYSAPERFGVQGQVKFLNYVSDQDLPYLYAAAKLFALPSLYEGFGLPILESYAVGTPVVTSNVSSMPEVGGGIAIYVDPYSVASIEEGLRKGLVVSIDGDQVNEHLGKFSWQKAALESENVFRTVLSRKNQT